MIATEPSIQSNPQAVRVAIASEPLKGITVERFQAIMNWVAAQPGVPPDYANALRAAGWLQEVSAFRDLEEALVSEGSHRPCLSALIATGETLVWAGKRHGMAATGSPFLFTLEDVEATLDSLHTTFRCEYGPPNSEKTNKLIERLFDVPQP
jgi:hypothetical protein